MSEISEDPRCQKIERELDYYAEKTRAWQIERNRYVKRGDGNKFKYANFNPYPYDDIVERRVVNQIDEYLLSFGEKERAEVNGHFLWKYKEYFSQPFAKHAVNLLEKHITSYPLSDANKIKFLEYLFKYQDETGNGILFQFDDRVLYKLVDFDPNNNLEATNRIYYKALAALSGRKHKNDEKIRLLYGMSKIFAKNIKKVSSEAAVNYAGIYFRMAERTDKRLDASILERLAVKTPYALERAGMCGDKEVLDKKVIKEIFKAYVGYANRQKDFNQNLGMEMAALAQNLFAGYGYTVKEAKDLTDILHFKDKDENGKKIRENMVNKALDSMASALDKYIDNATPMQRSLLKDVDKENPRINHARVVDYADRLFAFAAKNPEKDIWLNTLANMLTNGEKFDKNLVLDVVDAYGQSVSGRDIDQMSYNQILHHKMTRLLQGIAVKYDYLPNDMDELCRHIEKGADGHDEFVEMGRVVKAKLVQVGDWRYENSQCPVIPAIIHKKGGKSL